MGWRLVLDYKQTIQLVVDSRELMISPQKMFSRKESIILKHMLKKRGFEDEANV